MLRKLIILSFLMLSTVGCSMTTGGFITDDKRYYPLSKVEKKHKQLKIKIPNPQNKTIIIYNHGTTNSWLQEDCDKTYNQIPARFHKLTNQNTVLYYLCSKVTDMDKPGTYTFRRANEIENVLDKLIAIGVNPKNIFLAGHSAGAWAILLMNKRQKSKFNGFFITAPAMAGKIAQMHTKKPYQKAYYKQLKLFNKLPQKGIMINYANDSWMRESDWKDFVNTHSPKVKFYLFDCGYGHLSNQKDCRGEKINKIVRKFMNESR